MATQIIPQKKIITCDVCDTDENRKQEAVLTIKQHGLDLLGNPVCDGSQSWDLCDTCLGRIHGAISMEMVRIKLPTY